MIYNFKAVLFDFDGTLADTMQDNFSAWKKAFRNFGVKIKEKDYFPLEGMKLIGIATEIGNKYNVDEKHFKNIVDFKNKYYLDNHSFSFYPKVIELVDFLKKRGKLLALVSASQKEKLEKTVRGFFLDKFDAVICEEDYKKGKPDPEPYLLAIKKLNLSPEECLAVENAPFGIKSAKFAGIYCIALSTTLNEKYLKKADLVLKNHRKLIKFLRG